MILPTYIGPMAAFAVAVSVWGSIASDAPVRAAEHPRGLVYRCRLVATDRGDEITLSLRLRTNEPHGRWRIRMFHERERIVHKGRRTDADGDLRVSRIIADEPRRHDVIGRARHLVTGAVCEVRSRV